MGELLTDALVREVKEETGFEVKHSEILMVTDDFFYHPFKKKPYQTPLMYFLCEITGGKLSDIGFDNNEKEYAKLAKWIPLTQVQHLKFYNPIDNQALIQKALKWTIVGRIQRKKIMPHQVRGVA